jgi:hypothetical protein
MRRVGRLILYKYNPARAECQTVFSFLVVGQIGKAGGETQKGPQMAQTSTPMKPGSNPKSVLIVI